MRTFKASQSFPSLALFIAILGALVASPTTTLAEGAAPHWEYGGAANPTQWGRLGHDFAKCEVGKSQSPVDIHSTAVGSPARIEFNYAPTPLVVVNNGHTIQVNYQPGSTVSINGEKYELVQFHFHTPSEHELLGKASAMELHLVHRNQKGQLAVIGILINEGTANPIIDTIWKHMPKSKGTNTDQSVTINAASLLPKSTAYYSYSGSLTTPPCSEAVQWNVLVEPIQVSEEQVAAFESLFQVNARPIQPLNGRTVLLHR